MAESGDGLLAKLAASWPPERWRDVTALVAVSGGADSVALARALVELRVAGEGRLVFAHYNHCLRGADSDADQAFVEELGRELGIEVVVGSRGGEGAGGGEEASEESLRGMRYSFLARAADERGARYVATAHTADDQVETVIHNVIRGTGLAGLAGMPRVRQFTEAAALVRPLLDVTRAEVLEYLQGLGQTFREDATNSLTEYTRNRIRQRLLPLLEREFNPHIREAVLRLAKIADETDDLLSQQAGALLQAVSRLSGDLLEIQCEALEGTHPTLLREVLMRAWQNQGWPLQEMSLEKWEQLRTLVCQIRNSKELPAGQMFPGGIRAERTGEVLQLTRLD